MSAAITDTTDNILTVRVSGTLSPADQKNLQRSLATYLEQSEKVRILIDAEAFEGWEKTEDWGNISISFPLRVDNKIDRMAVLARPKWHEDLLMFLGAGYRGFPIRNFRLEDTDKARLWLLSEQPASNSQ